MNLADCGFRAGAGRRLALAAAYAALALAAVIAIEGRARPTMSATTSTPATGGEIELTLESTYPVAAWSVRHAGRALTPDSPPDATRWRGRVPGGAPTTVNVQADAADPLADAPCALRVSARCDGQTSATVLWGRGFVSASVPLPLLKGAP